MLVRIGSCQVCEATFSLPASFEAPWVGCRICSGPVQVGPPEEAEQALKRASRRGGAAKGETGKKEGSKTKAAVVKNGEAGNRAEPSASAGVQGAAAGLAAATSAAVGASAATAIASTHAGASAGSAASHTSAPASGPASGPSTSPKAPSAPPAGAAPAAAAQQVTPPSKPAPSPTTAAPATGGWSPAALEAEVRAKGQRQGSATSAERAEPLANKAAELAPRPKPQRSDAEPAPKPSSAKEIPLEEMPLEELLLAPPPPKLSTLERLKAERTNSAPKPAAHKPESPAPADRGSGERPSGTIQSTLDRLKAERLQAQSAPPATKAASRATAQSGQRPQHASTAAQGKVASSSSAALTNRRPRTEQAQDEGQTDKKDGRGGSKRRPPGGSAPRERGAPKAGLLGLAGLAVLSVMLFFGFREGGFLNGKPANAKPETPEDSAQAASATVPSTTQVDPFSGGSIPLPTGLAVADPAAQTPAMTDAEKSVTPPPAAQTPPSPAPVAAKPKNDPDSVNLAAYGPFPSLPETSSEDEERIAGWVKDLFNPNAGASAGRARTKLIEMGKAAIPGILNALIALDCGTQDGMLVGNDGVQVLEKICNGTNYGWRTSDDPGESEYYNKRAIELWCKAWTEASADEAKWKQLAKLDQAEESAPEEASDE
jgi:hypothetical protein